MSKKKPKTAQLKELQKRWRTAGTPDSYPRPTGPITVDGKKRRWM